MASAKLRGLGVQFGEKPEGQRRHGALGSHARGALYAHVVDGEELHH